LSCKQDDFRIALAVADHPCSIAITGLVVLGGHTRVQDPYANFRNAFEGKATGYGMTNSLVKIIFSYAGYENAFNIVNEIQVSGPSLTIQEKEADSRHRTLSRPSKGMHPTLWSQ
jgi:hypothetical protein